MLAIIPALSNCTHQPWEADEDEDAVDDGSGRSENVYSLKQRVRREREEKAQEKQQRTEEKKARRKEKRKLRSTKATAWVQQLQGALGGKLGDAVRQLCEDLLSALVRVLLHCRLHLAPIQKASTGAISEAAVASELDEVASDLGIELVSHAEVVIARVMARTQLYADVWVLELQTQLEHWWRSTWQGVLAQGLDGAELRCALKLNEGMGEVLSAEGGRLATEALQEVCLGRMCLPKAAEVHIAAFVCTGRVS